MLCARAAVILRQTAIGRSFPCRMGCATLDRRGGTGVRLTGSASCVESPAGIECFVRGPRNDVLGATFFRRKHVSGNMTIPASGRRDWGGTLTSATSCVQESDAVLSCAGRGLNGERWSRRLDSRQPADAWSSSGGGIASDPACVVASGNTTGFAVGLDNGLQRLYLGSGDRTSYVAMPHCVPSPAVSRRG